MGGGRVPGPPGCGLRPESCTGRKRGSRQRCVRMERAPEASAAHATAWAASSRLHARKVRWAAALKLRIRLQCGSPYLAYWNWPFSAGSMPRFPSSARAENGCNRRVWLIREGSYRSGTHNSKPRFGRGPRRQPPGRRIPRQAAGDIGPNRRGRLGPTDPQWPLPYPAGLWP